ncbi:hypothetical protein E4U39_006113 [Claviceps sp. Clav50 group G5]|nr:hypothetical protein E4U39_006113 [Claviceps sp. Clav50 group G5]
MSWIADINLPHDAVAASWPIPFDPCHDDCPGMLEWRRFDDVGFTQVAGSDEGFPP